MAVRNFFEDLAREAAAKVLDKLHGESKFLLGAGQGVPAGAIRIEDLADGIARLGDPVQLLGTSSDSMLIAVRHGPAVWRCVMTDTGKAVSGMALTSIHFRGPETPDGFAEFLLDRNAKLGSTSWARVQKQLGYHYFPRATLPHAAASAQVLHQLAYAMTHEAAELSGMLGLTPPPAGSIR